MSARIVIAATQPMVGRILAHKLRREQHDVVVTVDARAAQQQLSAGVDAALVDSELLAELDGIAVPWLAIVEGRDAAAAERAMAAGAAGLVRTPFKPTAVAEEVRVLLRLVMR